MASENSAVLGVMPVPGDLVAGKYRVLRTIGEGGMGVVFEAIHEGLSQHVALKVLRCNELDKVEEYFGRFEREARSAAKLKGRNVARVTDVDTLQDGTPFMVMEYLDGYDLDSEIERRGRVPIVEAVDFVVQACSGVAEAHSRGIVHRDLKPHNLFLTHEDGVVVIKLLDFGISKVQDERETSVTLTRSTLGTPLYMSPEQIRATRNADERSDIWSLGVILYELLTGQTPYDGENPAAVIAAITADEVPPPNLHRPDLPDELTAVVMKALCKRPEGRYQSAGELARALSPFNETTSWVPPPRVSGLDFRVVMPDSPTVNIRDLEEPGQLALERSEASQPGIRGRWKLLGLVGVAAVATLVFVATPPSEPPLAAPAPSVSPTTQPSVSEGADPVRGPAPAQAAASPQIPPSGQPKSSAARTTPSAQVPAAKPKRRPKFGSQKPPAAKQGIKPGPTTAPEPPPPAPAPPPATENPVHL